MSRISTGIFGGLAVVLTLGAVQFAAGRDLPSNSTDAASASSAVNRAVKSDRATVQSTGVSSRTVSVRLESLPNTSVLIRIPQGYRIEARDRAAKSDISDVRTTKRPVACEPVVSVLTAVAKQLQPGRCVT